MKEFRTLKKLWFIIERKDKKKFFFIFSFMILGTLIELISVGIVVPVFAIIGNSDVLEKYPIIVKFFGISNYKIIVLYAMIFLLGIYVIKTIFLSFSAIKQSDFIYGLSAKFSSKLFFLYLNQPYEFHLQRNSAQLIRNTTTDVVMMSTALQSLIIILTETFVTVGVCILLIAVEPLGALVSSSVLICSALLFHMFSKKKIIQWGESNHLHAGKRFQHLQQGFGASKDTILYGRSLEFVKQFDIHNKKMAIYSEKQYTISQLPRLFIELLAIAGLTLLVITMLLLDKNITSILPTLALFAAAAFRLMPSLNRVLGSIQAFQFGLPSINTIYSEITEHKIIVDVEKQKLVNFTDKVVFSNVWFNYMESKDDILKEINATIYKGQSIGIIGGSGAGKSTFVDIFLGLLKPKSGQILVDGVNIQNGLRSWQDQIGYVPQNIYLTDDSLKKNIAFGIPIELIDDNSIFRAIKAAQLDLFVGSLPDGIETEVGERGVRLSGGQRQRIGIARALYHNPKILVLDEATSALDYTTESEVMDSIKALHGEKTILIVAHRLSTIEHCDRIFNFEGGVINISNKKLKTLIK